MPQKRTYSANLDIVADKMVGEKCHVTILGDSINNPSYANSMRSGYVNPLKWTPLRWRGISTALNDGVAESGFRLQSYGLSANTTPTYAYLDKDDSTLPSYIHNRATEVSAVGNIECDVNSIVNYSNSFRLTQISQPTIANGNVSIYGTAQEDAGTVSTFYNTPGYTIKSLFYSDSAFTMGAKFRTLDLFPQTSVTYDIVPGYNTVSYTLSPSTLATNITAATAEYFFNAGTTAGTNIGLISTYIYNPNIEGLSLSYLGAGGWQIENHSSPTGNDLPPAEADRLGWYSTEALVKHFEFYETDVCMIWLGANSSYDLAALASDDYIEKFDELLSRLRGAAAAANRSIKFVAVAQYELSDARILKIKDFLETKAGYDDYLDVAFINLYQKIKDDGVNGGDYSDYVSSGYLVDSTHPSDTGADYFASKLWEIIVDSSNYNFDSPWDFQVAQARPGSWEDLSGDISYETNDVVQELSKLPTKEVDENSEYDAFLSGISAFKKGKK